MGLKLEDFLSNGTYCKKDAEFNVEDNKAIWSISGHKAEEEKVYTYDEAIELTGNGWYNISLLITLVLSVQAMALDMFGFSYVVAAAACDLRLSHRQTSFLLTVPLIGAITSAYPYGYISDKHGRKKCLSTALWTSFVVACLSALSPNFIVLAVLKFFSSSMSSGVQSMSFTLLGECCSGRTKGRYVVILTSAFVCGFAVFTTHAYLVLGLDFSYDLGFIIFKPWRLLILTLAIALGTSAVLMTFSYESPKFLVSIGKTAEAVEILKQIKKRNQGGDYYPVKKIVLLETNSIQRNDVPFLRSLWDQTVPLFKPPLLQKTLLLFYIIANIYSVNNGFFFWVPILTRAFFNDAANATKNATESFCNMIMSPDASAKSEDCSAGVSLEMLVISIIHGAISLIILFAISMLAHKKKAIIIFVCVLSSFSCIALNIIPEKFTTMAIFFVVQANCFIMGIVFYYFIELYPTRYRGMITCLGVMVARLSGMAGVNLVGAFTFTHCTESLYIWAAYIFSGALMGLLLPSDTPNKS